MKDFWWSRARGAIRGSSSRAHDALRGKLLPKVCDYGFLNPDVQLCAE